MDCGYRAYLLPWAVTRKNPVTKGWRAEPEQNASQAHGTAIRG